MGIFDWFKKKGLHGFSVEELAAFVKTLEALANSDDDYDKDEESYILSKLNELNNKRIFSNQAEFEGFQDKMNSLEFLDLVPILQGMTDDKKQILADAMEELSLIDGVKDLNESKFKDSLFRLIENDTKGVVEEINNETFTLLKVYPNLKGVDLSVVKNAPLGDSAGSVFCSDLDGRWYFAVTQMTMLFKAISEENITVELNAILELNNINLDDKIEGAGYVAWKGNGFQIEHTLIENCNVIIITNEDVAEENAAQLTTTTWSKEVDLPVGYENIGIDKIYDGEEFLKANEGHSGHSIPLLFNDNAGNDFILIGASTSTIAKIIIDDILEKNYGKAYFEENTDAPAEWEYLHINKFIAIGYLPKEFCVKINLLHKLMKVGG